MELFLTLPLWYQYLMVGLFGLIIGSFLNVYIYRLHTGRSLRGSSHCLSCGTALRWHELLPIASYLVLRGRCRNCGSYIPVRYLLVEALTAALFLWSYVVLPLGGTLLLWWLLLACLVVITVYDLYHLIIPNELTLVATFVLIALLLLTTDAGTWWPTLASAAGGAVATMAVYGGLWFVSKGRWIGFGDVKLALPFGFFLGLLDTLSFIILSFWVGAVLSVTVMGVQKVLKRGQYRLPFVPGPITMKSEVPFAPFLIIAFLLVALCHANVVVLIDSLMVL